MSNGQPCNPCSPALDCQPEDPFAYSITSGPNYATVQPTPNPPCSGCGAPIDCETGNDYQYSLTADPILPYFFLCPPPYTCRPAPGPGNTVTSSPISLDCCGHHFTALIYSNSTDAEVSNIVNGLVNQCIAVSSQCADVPVNPNDPGTPSNPVTIYYSNPRSCVSYCPDGTAYTYSLRAGATFGYSQFIADSIAASICFSRANANRLCLGDLFELGCADTTIFEDLYASSINTPIVFAVTAGAIPTGTAFFSVDPNTAALAGTLTTPGVYTFTVSATDSTGYVITKSYTIWVFGITNASLPDGIQNTFYSQQLLTGGNTGAVTFDALPEDLPAGLVMDSEGLITGTPTVIGATGFEVTITDSEGSTCNQIVTINILSDCIPNSGTLPNGTENTPYL